MISAPLLQIAPLTVSIFDQFSLCSRIALRNEDPIEQRNVICDSRTCVVFSRNPKNSALCFHFSHNNLNTWVNHHFLKYLQTWFILVLQNDSERFKIIDEIDQKWDFSRVGNHAKRANVRCALWMMRAVFTISDLGPRRLCAEQYVSVKSTVTGCDVTYCATTLQGFNKHATSRRKAVSDSRGVPRCTEKITKNIYTCSHVSIVRLVQSTIPVSSDSHSHSSPLCHLPGELVSISSVPIPSIDLNLWNRSRPSTFVSMSLGITSFLTDDIVKSFRNTKS